MRVLIAVLLCGCSPAYVIVGEDAARPDAPSDAGVDAPLPVEPPAGSECDQQDDCNACGQCSSAPFEYCNRAALACEDIPACVALNDCVRGCTDRDCTRRCGELHPEGIAPLTAFVTCAICTACPADCRSRTALYCEAPPF